MNLQANINQLLTTAGMAYRLSPMYEKGQHKEALKAESKEAVGKAKAAQAGISDISKNLANPEKEYSLTELKDIESRVAEHNRNIYSAKTMAIPGHPNAPYTNVSDLPAQSMYKQDLQSIEGNIEKRRKAISRMQNDADAKLNQDKEFAAIRELILHPERLT